MDQILARDRLVPIRLTDVELEDLQGAADAVGQTLSEWIRNAIVLAVSLTESELRERDAQLFFEGFLR